jgi:hypothetical protein
MALPTTRAELIQYCKEACGAPVITINVADIQIDHAIDNALELFLEYHHEGTRTEYIAKQLTQTDIDNGFVPWDTDVLSVTKVLSVVDDGVLSGGGDAMFSPIYQLRLNDLYDLGSVDMTYYTIARQYINSINDSLLPEFRYSFNRYESNLVVHTDWDKEFKVGNYIVGESERLVGESISNGKIYSNRVIRNLAAAYTKQIWGGNLSKFGGIQLPGGVTLDASSILQEAEQEINKYEDEIKSNYRPLEIFYG